MNCCMYHYWYILMCIWTSCSQYRKLLWQPLYIALIIFLCCRLLVLPFCINHRQVCRWIALLSFSHPIPLKSFNAHFFIHSDHQQPFAMWETDILSLVFMSCIRLNNHKEIGTRLLSPFNGKWKRMNELYALMSNYFKCN